MATKQGLAPWPPRYRTAWKRQYQCVPRWVRFLAIATISVFGTLGMLHGLRNFHDNDLKQYSTDFTGLQFHTEAWMPSSPIRTAVAERHIDDQYHYLRHLGQGAEGSAELYMDASNGDTVVIKTFKIMGRNELPLNLLTSEFANYTTSWPTEIEAGLVLGDASVRETYIPVLDYFILQTEGRWSWALVTPFVSGGTLINLAARERRRQTAVELVDEVYRPVLKGLLFALAPLHAANLCHDDIKPDNVFIESEHHWRIGDLGGIRHTKHPWHSTATWQIQNQWPNCEFNDIRRMLKTYTWFLREASGDKLKFDCQFWGRNTSWSKLYWDYVQYPVDIETTLATFEMETNRTVAMQEDGRFDMSHESDAELRRATEAELTCTTVPRRLWKHWWWPFWATQGV